MVKYFRSHSPDPGESNMALLGIRLAWGISTSSKMIIVSISSYRLVSG